MLPPQKMLNFLKGNPTAYHYSQISAQSFFGHAKCRARRTLRVCLENSHVRSPLFSNAGRAQLAFTLNLIMACTQHVLPKTRG